MSIYNNWNLNPIICDLSLENICEKIILRTNYFNNGIQSSNYFYDKNNLILLHDKFSSKNICDYYKGYSLINNGLYKNHLIDPSSLHLWDSTFENDQEVLNIRKKILENINAKYEDYKIYLPIQFNNTIYCYIQIGQNYTPSSQDLTYLNDSINSIQVFDNLKLTYPKLNLELNGLNWHEKHFPIFINKDLYDNLNNFDYVKLIYFYYQRQNPYIQKKYILSTCENSLNNFYLDNFENICILKNKYLIFNYGYYNNIYCTSFLNDSVNGCYNGENYSGEFIGSFSSEYQQKSLINYNNIYTSIDSNNCVYNFQQCIINFGTHSGFYFNYCKNNFFSAFCCEIESIANIWYCNITNFNQQYNGLPNLDLYSESNTNPLISSDYFSQIKCKNVII